MLFLKPSRWAILLLTLFFLNEASAFQSRKLFGAPKWLPVGDIEKKTTKDDDTALFPVISTSADGTLYTAYISPFKGGLYPKSSTVMQNDATSNLHIYKHEPAAKTWTKLADPAGLGSVNGIDLAVDPSTGVLFLAASSGGPPGFLSLYKYEENKWEVLQEKFPGKATVRTFNMKISPAGVPYICTVLGTDAKGSLSVYKYDASSKQLIAVGEGGLPSRYSGRIAFHKEQPYLAYKGLESELIVKTFADNKWKPVGNFKTENPVGWYSIDVDGKTGTVFVGYGMYPNQSNGKGAAYYDAQKYQGGAWKPLGKSKIIPPGYEGRDSGSMVLDQASSTPWIIYYSRQRPSKTDSLLHIIKFSNGGWTDEGTIGTSTLVPTKYFDMTISDGPKVVLSYVAPQIEANAGLVSVYGLSK